ncbi:hypothetical protein AwErysi_07420 [Erysipelotrichaceae bacterium]|nr:hypothetical protein AwErysi_07420 [Erysipelotrichaceae bacterium]
MIHIEKEIFTVENDLLTLVEWQKEHKITAGFTTKNGGESVNQFTSLNLSYTVGDNQATVLKNRKSLAEKIGIPYEKWVFSGQNHTKNIAEVTMADCGAGAESFESGIANVDGMYTKESGIVLAAFFADCTPIYFIAPKHNLIGIVHAGWSGSIQEISRAFVKKWFSLGVKAKEIEVIIGPSASQSAYHVGADIAKAVANMELLDARDAIIDLGNEQFKLDTAYLNYLQLIDLDIPADNIIMSSYCTISDKDLFFSFRRDGETGRMLGYITQ